MVFLRTGTVVIFAEVAEVALALLADNGASALSPAEQQSHIALWALLKSPLLLSCDVRSLSNSTLAMLLNQGMLDIADDPLAQQAKRIRALKFRH